MPILSDEVLDRLSAYKLPDRNGYDVAKPSKDMKDMACWCWAISGSLMSVADPKSANSVYDNLVKVNMLKEPPEFDSYVDADTASGHYGKSILPYFAIAKANEAKAKKGDKKARDLCKVAMMQIMATLHGRTPTGKPGVAVDPAKSKEYTLHMRTKTWYSWDHWAIGVPLKDGRRMYIQTVTGVPLSYACTTIWDEGMPELVIGIGTLSKGHVAEIDKIPDAKPDQRK